MGANVRAAVLGASGYTGGELVRLLAAHPTIEVTFLGGHGSVGTSFGEAHPHLASLPVASTPLAAAETRAVTDAADLVFSALPHGASARIVPELLDAGLRVVDLAGDFRLGADAYPEWYGWEHPAPERLDKAVYGLPELFGDRIAGAELVANPGCYPTPVILGLVPLLTAGLVDPGPVRVDGKTGLSGAGKAANASTTFAATEDSVRPYRAPRHQHTPEMERGIELGSGRSVPVLFVPHLVPTVRGVVTTAYAPLAEGVTSEALTERLVEAYAGRPFVRVLASGEMVDSKRTRGTNVIGAVDNLVKGAAGQAIQNANLALGLPEGSGLPTLAVYP